MAAQSSPNLSQVLTALTPPSASQPAYYGMVMLAMASQAYTAQGNAAWPVLQSSLYTAITNTTYTPALPTPLALLSQGATVAGSWQLDWGPGNGQNGNGDNSNLIFIASYRNPAGAPYFFVVSIRGTDTSVTGAPLHQQLLQDIRDFKLISWQSLLDGTYKDPIEGPLSVPVLSPARPDVPGGNVAHGSALGFAKIANFTAPLNNGGPPAAATGTPVAVLDALQSLLGAKSDIPIGVTGHSLGACQTQLMATYLAWQFPDNQVIPYAYAPPTAGDQQFIAGYSGKCPAGQFWFNDHDVVPFAFIMTTDPKTNKPVTGLSIAAKTLWTAYTWPTGLFAGAQTSGIPVNPSGQPGPPLPPEMIALIDGLDPFMPSVYVRPANGVFHLTGNIPPMTMIVDLLAQLGGGMAKFPPDGGVAQLVWQHFPPCYGGLMTQQYGTNLAPFDFQSYKPPPPPTG